MIHHLFRLVEVLLLDTFLRNILGKMFSLELSVVGWVSATESGGVSKLFVQLKIRVDLKVAVVV